MKKVLLLTLLMPMAVMGETLVSPNGKITAQTSQHGITISYCGSQVLDIPVLGMAIDGKESAPAEITSVSAPKQIHEAYTMLAGKKLQCSNDANAYTLTCSPVAGKPQSIELRLYNDGIAYRYDLSKLKKNVVSDEYTTYRIAEGTNRWLQRMNEAYEDFYPLYTTGNTDFDQFGYPALLQPAEDVFVLITEADMHRNQSASYLENKDSRTDYRVVWPENKVKNSGTWSSPWRVAIVGSLADVVESTLVTDVSTPCQLSDTSWIHPGSVAWVYWAYNHGSNDYQIVKKYIDMAAKLGMPYMLIDAEWDEMSNGGTIEDAVGYANSVGVKPLIWYNSSTGWLKEWGAPGPHNRLNDRKVREAEFDKISKMGVAGVKIDFFAGDKQEMMDYYIDLLESAAKYNLLVNFHGATVPRGWQRTYPNMMSVEGVYGEEWYNNKPTMTTRAAAHNATLPFTRNVIGPMDYTPCAFSDSQHPHITTNAHELALPVLYETALLHWADKPESYYAQPKEVQEFMGQLPTVWDETRLLGGYPADYVVMARRSGDTWYVAGINGHDAPINIDIDWTVLADGKTYDVEAFADGAFGEPWSITRRQLSKQQMPTNVTMQPRGGFVVRIK